MNWEQKWESLARRWLPAAYLAIFLSGMASFAEAADVPALYKEHCVACHGENRLGGIGPALLPENLERLRKPEAAKVIRALPADLAAQIDYVRVGSVDEITLVLGNGRSVLWGSAADSQQKAEVLAVLLKQPGNRLDVSIPSQPTIK